jgi:hypothetical protein
MCSVRHKEVQGRLPGFRSLRPKDRNFRGAMVRIVEFRLGDYADPASVSLSN